jgi:outer membrane protein assembly factor BamB
MKRTHSPFPLAIFTWAAWLHPQAGAGEATFYAPPKPLPAGAVTTDWQRFLGPKDHPVSPETKLLAQFPENGPAKVWEIGGGEGYAAPAVSKGKIFLFHRMDGKEQIWCLDAETGKKRWEFGYAVEYRDRYGYGAGPRAGAVVDAGQVFTFGVTSQLHALDVETGKVLWHHDCAKEYGVPQYFFGSGASPLVLGDHVILNLGGKDELCVAAFDRKDGKLVWQTRHEWGQSYASPIPATLRGEQRVLVFAGGESDPTTGGILSLLPQDGKIEDAFFWRARRYPSVNASTPVLVGENRVFVTQSYVDRDSPCNGGVMLEMTAERKWKEVWKAPDFGCHWMTPVLHDGHLYGFSGEKENNCDLVCYDATSGKKLWSERPEWSTPYPKSGGEIPISFKRASLLRVDGRFLCLGEWGTLAWLDLSPKGVKVLSKCQPFLAQQSWSLPVLSRGLLYVSQHETDELTGIKSRVICFDLRAAEPTKG